MKYVIKIQVLKALSIATLLISTSQTVYSVTGVGKDVPALQEALQKIHEASQYTREKIIDPNIKHGKLNMPNKDLRGATVADHLRPYLYGSHLAGSNLTGASLSGINLNHANLTNTNFTNANLTRAILWNANLTNANFLDGVLKGASFLDGDLTDANLTRANLTGATLTRANLTRANLSGARGLTPRQKFDARRSQGAINVPD